MSLSLQKSVSLLKQLLFLTAFQIFALVIIFIAFEAALIFDGLPKRPLYS